MRNSIKDIGLRWLLAVLCALSPATFAEGTQELQEYVLGTGDKLRVVVFGHEDLSGEFEIDSAGRLSLPLIRDVGAAGMTTEELAQSITARLKPDYLKNPKVNVEVINYRPFYIMGEVANPGSYPYVNDMTVLTAVAVAGGFTYRASKDKIYLVRESETEQERIRVTTETMLQPGDLVEVKERFF
jgi:polysaccharide export outer membrane protein